MGGLWEVGVERRDSVSMAPRKMGSGSSSRWEGISTLTLSQASSPRPLPLMPVPPPPSRSSSSSESTSSSPPPGDPTPRKALGVRSTSALTPAIASVPSLKQTRALPLGVGRMLVSATSGRNCVGVRRSGRIGGVSVSEVCR